MLAIIFLVLSVLWLCVATYFFWLALTDYDGEHFFFWGVIVLAITLFFNAIPLFSQIGDVALIRNAESLYTVRESAIGRVSKELESLPGQTALMNADSPAKTLIETKSKYVTDLTELKMQVAQAKVSIERRKMGPSAWAVWLIGE